MRIDPITVGMLEVNCYLVWDEATRQALVVDPGADAPVIAARIAAHELRPAGILLTHAHVDHIGAVPELAREFALPVEVHPDEQPLYSSPDNAVLPWLPAVRALPPPSAVPRDLPGRLLLLLRRRALRVHRRHPVSAGRRADGSGGRQ